jgi:putative ABC transport system permease protein
MVRSLLKLQSVDPGFDPKSLLTVKLQVSPTKYKELPQVAAVEKEFRDRIAGIPGVSAVSAVNYLPLTGIGASTSVTIDGRPQEFGPDAPNTDVRVVADDYFRTMGIPLVAGRTFNERELTQPSGVVIINETMARRYWPGEDPVGKRILIEMKDENSMNEIIGIVKDTKVQGLDEPSRPMSYWPIPELPYPGMSYVIRTDGNPAAVVGLVRDAIWAIDRDQPLADVRTMDQVIGETLSRARFTTLLLGVFSLVAVLLAAIGIYGVMSYTVAERTQEIGIRMALGAEPGAVVRLVVRQGLLLAGIGTGAGLLVALGVTRLLGSMLFEMSPSDPVTFAGVAAGLVVVATVACFIPARRAARVDPMEALRYE